MTATVVQGLSERIGTQRVVEDPAELRRWSVDGAVPAAVVFPRDVEELAELLAWASVEGSTVVPAGRGSWIAGGGPVDAADVVVSTARMAEVVEYEPGDLTLTAGAGLPLAELQRRAGEHGQWLPQDPPGWRHATVGAFVSTGLPGPLVAGFGRPRDHVLGVTVVTGDGRVVRPGGRVVKNVAGFDLVRLLTGSWGGLGVIAAATVRLFPRPARDVTLVFGAGESRALQELARRLATAPIVPDALELVAPAEGPLREAAGGSASTAGSRAAVTARLLGTAPEVEEKKRILVEAAGRGPERVIGGDGTDGDARRIRPAAETRLRGDGAPPETGLSVRLALLPDRLGTLLEAAGELRALAGEEGRPAAMRAHPTRGVLRVEVGGSSEGERGRDRWAELLLRLRADLAEEGGSLTLVRAPADTARRVGLWGDPGGAGRLLRGLKEEFDPAGVLVPGRFGFREKE